MHGARGRHYCAAGASGLTAVEKPGPTGRIAEDTHPPLGPRQNRGPSVVTVTNCLGSQRRWIAMGVHIRRFRAIGATTLTPAGGYLDVSIKRTTRRLTAMHPSLMSGILPWLAVAAGGALGSVARFWMTGAMTSLTGPRFPYGTLLINILGSFVIGLVAGLTLTPARMGMHPDMRIFLMVGVCGGFTTFSAFSLQTLELIQTGDTLPALLYIVASVVLCVLFVWFGWWLGRP
jgi:CrcB protein